MGRWLAAVALVVLAAEARADAPLAPPIFEPPAPRELAMGGALRASGSSNEAIWLNPAALGDVQRYGLSFDGLYDLHESRTTAGLAIADSTTAPVTGGIAAHRFWLADGHGGRIPANVFNLAVSTALADAVVLGAGGKLIHTREADGGHNRLTPDVGLLFKASPLNVAVTGTNLVATSNAVAPRQFAVAANLALPKLPKVEGDVVFDTATRSDVTMAYRFGAEYEVIPLLALRGGYAEDRTLMQRTVSGGLGFYIPPGVGIDISYAHALLGDRPPRELMMGVNLSL